ncbi:MAG: dTDP-4-dehydrorhamnose 3,5-epimerase family protein [Methanobacterium sp.]|uniref:dTDP-4-dehydrorhamnose 3,5-epimerase family protein n=1 Tax=Methanobacterium sp. TaxID=2164 RepID=UPI003D645EF6|nr:dTDP-4-dehydrorhamnose 3,5-epimerase family protein [Methanobacterium sp.]
MIYKNENLLKIPGIKGKYIKDVEIKALKRIPDERGSIYHMLRSDDEIFEDFGEIYFSSVYPEVIKGWHIHKKMILNYAVIHGMIKLVLYDDRENSKTHGNLMEIFIGEENYLLVKIPPNIWNGFKGIGETKAIIANCASIPHDSEEISRKDPFTTDIPYEWKKKHE